MEKDRHQDHALALHNQARKDAPGPPRAPLVWSSTLCLAALAYAEHLAKTKIIKHDPSLPHSQGENIYWSSATTSPSSTLIAAANAWIDEGPGYHGEPISPELNARGVVGHYTQVIWPATRKVGIAKVKGKNGTYIVARYEPRGNIRGESAWGASGSLAAAPDISASTSAKAGAPPYPGLNDGRAPYPETAIGRMTLSAITAVENTIRGNYPRRGGRRGKVFLGGLWRGK